MKKKWRHKKWKKVFSVQKIDENILITFDLTKDIFHIFFYKQMKLNRLKINKFSSNPKPILGNLQVLLKYE